MTEADEDHYKLAALHRHWLIADSVNYHLRRSSKAGTDEKSDLLSATAQVARQASTVMAITVWYALLYVVVEGYRDLELEAAEIDDLLSEKHFVEGLRRFRNATFHYQADLLSPKLTDFIQAADSEKWIQSLNAAFRRFFEERLDLRGVLARLGGSLTPL